jgi:glycerol uptake facilitator-like aquaporin
MEVSICVYKKVFMQQAQFMFELVEEFILTICIRAVREEWKGHHRKVKKLTISLLHPSQHIQAL